LIRERKQIAGDGILTPVLTLNAETGELELPPELVARGVVGFEGSNGLASDAKKVISQAVETASDAELDDLALLKERVRVELKRFVQKQTGTRPVITPVVLEV
jgi:ribonuclease J